MSDFGGRNFIIVPESLEADPKGFPTDRPSFAFRQVLDHVLSMAVPSDNVYLAPANTFGGAMAEEQTEIASIQWT